MKTLRQKAEEYPVGARVSWPGQDEGTVVENVKMPGDIMITWDRDGGPFSYDAWFLAKHNVTLLPPSERTEEQEGESDEQGT